MQLFFGSLSGKYIHASKDASELDNPVEHWKDSIVDKTDNYEKYGRVVLWPKARNKIMVRLENLADIFDMWQNAHFKVNM